MYNATMPIVASTVPSATRIPSPDVMTCLVFFSMRRYEEPTDLKTGPNIVSVVQGWISTHIVLASLV